MAGATSATLGGDAAWRDRVGDAIARLRSSLDASTSSATTTSGGKVCDVAAEMRGLVREPEAASALARDAGLAEDLARGLHAALLRSLDVRTSGSSSDAEADVVVSARLLRDGCAFGGERVQTTLGNLGVHARVLEALAATPTPSPPECKALMQLLGNLCVRHAANQEGVWAALDATSCGEDGADGGAEGARGLFAACADDPARWDVAWMVVYNCTLGSDARLRRFLHDPWRGWLVRSLTAPLPAAPNEAAALADGFAGLVAHRIACRLEGASSALLPPTPAPPLFAGNPNTSSVDTSDAEEGEREEEGGWGRAMAAVASCVRVAASEDDADADRGWPDGGGVLWRNLFHMLRWALCALPEHPQGPEKPATETLATDDVARPTRHVSMEEALEALVHAFREACVAESFVPREPSPEAAWALLSMLWALPRLEGRAGSRTDGNGVEVSYAPSSARPRVPRPPPPLPPSPPPAAWVFPVSPPYPGYRRDVLSVLANLSYKRGWVAQRVAEFGRPNHGDSDGEGEGEGEGEGTGVLLLLEQCQIADAGDELLREWGLFLVRNLCEVSATIREQIEGIKAQGAPQADPALARQGIRVSAGEDGKPVVSINGTSPRTA